MAKKKETNVIDKEIAMELAKGSLEIYRKLLNESRDVQLIINVTSREGNVKPEIHPIVGALAQAAETLRRQLSEWLVTPKSKKQGGRGAGGSTDADDPLSKLVEKLTDLDDD